MIDESVNHKERRHREDQRIEAWESERDQVKTPEELELIGKMLEEGRKKLPEEWKKEPEAVQDIYILHGVDIRERKSQGE